MNKDLAYKVASLVSAIVIGFTGHVLYGNYRLSKATSILVEAGCVDLGRSNPNHPMAQYGHNGFHCGQDIYILVK